MVSVIFKKEFGFIDGTVEGARIFQGRIIGWKHGLNEFFNAPLLEQLIGTGDMAFGAHNDYLRVLISNGFLGFGIYIFMLIYAGFKILRQVIFNASALNVIGLMLYLWWIIDAIGSVVGMYPETQWFIWGMIVLTFRGVDGLDIQTYQSECENNHHNLSQPAAQASST